MSKAAKAFRANPDKMEGAIKGAKSATKPAARAKKGHSPGDNLGKFLHPKKSKK